MKLKLALNKITKNEKENQILDLPINIIGIY